MTQENKQKKNFSLNSLDIIILLTIILSITGYAYSKSNKIPLNKIIEKKESIVIEVLIGDVFNETNIFKVGDKTAITIRNRPYKNLRIIKTESKPKLLVIPTLQGNFKTINDPTKTSFKDYYVTLTDTALKTKDGYVIGGNKIKIGNQVELEGFNYRLTGKVINIGEMGDES